MYIINKINFFFRGIGYCNASRKYPLTTVISSMSTMIYYLLAKKLNETSEVLLIIDFWSNRDLRSYIDITVDSLSN